MTSLVPLASFRAAWTSCAAESSGPVSEARWPARNSVGIVARPASRLRRETRDGLDASDTVFTPFWVGRSVWSFQCIGRDESPLLNCTLINLPVGVNLFV